jgi:hypothetical protein
MKIAEKVHWDDNDRKMVIQETIDPTVALENAKKLRSAGAGKMGESRLVGEVPMDLVFAWAREAGIRPDDNNAMSEMLKKKMLDPDFAAFRVWEGTY